MDMSSLLESTGLAVSSRQYYREFFSRNLACFSHFENWLGKNSGRAKESLSLLLLFIIYIYIYIYICIYIQYMENGT